MIDVEKVRRVAEEQLAGTELFVVDVVCSPSNEIELTIDSDGSVDLDSCVALSRAVEASFDREEEDFQLTVTSAGVGQPLKTLRQYRKLIGSPVEVVLFNGTKIVARLQAATEDAITLSYTAKQAVEGKKRKMEVEVVETYPLAEVKTTREYIDFK